jgi:DNA-binding SARP family transcriptional activator
MGTLRISLLGRVHVSQEAFSCESKITRAGQALLAYLVLQRHRSHSRDALAGLFWGDHQQAHARSCLSTALWRLRGILEPERSGIAHGTYLVITQADEISFNQASDYWLDVAVFEERVNHVLARSGEVLTPAQVQQLQSALKLYTGELLEGFYADWALRERARLRTLYLNSLTRLMDYFKQQGTQAAYEEGLECGRLVLQYDPLREDIHGEIMQLHLEHGQRALAVRQYEECRDLLAAELGVLPLEETRALYDHAMHLGGYPLPLNAPLATAGTADTRAMLSGDALPTDLEQALQQVQRAMHDLEEAREQLQRAVQLAQHLTEQLAEQQANPL